MTTVNPLPIKSYTLNAQKRGLSFSQQQRLWGWFFLSPWIIGFLVFTLFPIIASFIFTFTNFQLAQPEAIQFIGMANYVRLIHDSNVTLSLGITLRYALIAVPLSLIVPLFIALLLQSEHLLGKRVFLALFYLPYTVPMVSSIAIWSGVLNTESGWINQVLRAVGLAGPDWLYTAQWIYPAMFLVSLWNMGSAIIIMLTGLQNVPTELYEAAKIDGAGYATSFLRITLPMISPVIFYQLLLTVIGLLQFFTIPYVLSGGTAGPGNATLFYNVYLYRTAFVYQDMGYGATLAWLIFIISIIFTLIMFLTAPRWVYYAGEKGK